jgi:hypothetical protein
LGKLGRGGGVARDTVPSADSTAAPTSSPASATPAASANSDVADLGAGHALGVEFKISRLERLFDASFLCFKSPSNT